MDSPQASDLAPFFRDLSKDEIFFRDLAPFSRSSKVSYKSNSESEKLRFGFTILHDLVSFSTSMYQKRETFLSLAH